MTDATAPALQRVLGPIGVTMLTLSVLSPCQRLSPREMWFSWGTLILREGEWWT